MEPLTGVMRALGGGTQAWVCGACRMLTTETHFYADDKGIMQHGERPVGMAPPPPTVNEEGY